MGLISFIKGVGEKVFGKDEPTAADIQQKLEEDLGSQFTVSGVGFQDGTVTLQGEAADYAAKNKAVLIAGNINGVEQVDDSGIRIRGQQTATPAAAPEPEPAVTYYDIQKGDSLWKIAQTHYGDGSKYPQIFEANREVIKDADKIYPGQKIVIPAL